MKKLDETLTMLKNLTDAKGIPGNEKEARDVMTQYITPYADEVTTDNLGSLIAKKVGKENGPKIMVAGHLDEVGFMITRIDDKGFVYFQTVLPFLQTTEVCEDRLRIYRQFERCPTRLRENKRRFCVSRFVLKRQRRTQSPYLLR